MKPRVIVIRASGTNCDIETKNAFEHIGAKADLVHINELLKGYKKLSDYDIAAIPGGFSYGDDISAGKIFAIRIKKLNEDFVKFIKEKKPIIGICNGFQVLLKSGFLPYDENFKQRATLYFNDTGHFICRWVKVKANPKSPCIFTKGMDYEFYLPVAHGEGKFITDKKTLDYLEKNNLNSIKYIENPNGSMGNIAALTNEYGNVLGMMPHPERVIFKNLSPYKINEAFAPGYYFFKNAIDYVKS